ncbi:hypothetical protein CEXT_701831 [Caerostris extrusa]|uniref:Uncharacterized protein n=1 Tax=Caerostris extrusa TaxID=172846 RepID=A0AAV4VMF7_CAEEX|nr:hypothetical protein CEXT_701831 [Caerostris extrusa]
MKETRLSFNSLEKIVRISFRMHLASAHLKISARFQTGAIHHHYRLSADLLLRVRSNMKGETLEVHIIAGRTSCLAPVPLCWVDFAQKFGLTVECWKIQSYFW